MKLQEYSIAKRAIEKGIVVAPNESKFKMMIDECNYRQLLNLLKNKCFCTPSTYTNNLTKTNSISFLYFIKLSLNSLDLFLNYFHKTKIKKNERQ